MFNKNNIRLVLLFLCLVFAATGCATYGKGVEKSLDHVKNGQYTMAEEEIKKSLKPDGDDRLLYYVELGTIKRLGEKYNESNNHFRIAEQISEDMFTKKAGDVLSSLLMNPRQGAYPGNEFESIYINYYKALNYMNIAMNEGAKSYDDAKVELKRLDYKLKSYEIEKGNYKEVEDKKKKTFVKLLNIFKKFQGNWLDEDWLQFREDAHARYLAGVIYEMSRNYDSARISYQHAAKLYEEGYVKQYGLDPGITHRAWYDAIRMMIKGGGWENEWRNIASRKLPAKMAAKLKKLPKKNGEIVVIEHLGFSPQRKEMNLMLKADPGRKSFYLYPILTGGPVDKNDQRAWFFLLYSDKGVLDIIKNYSDGGLSQSIRGLQKKTISLPGPLWKVVENIGLVEAIGSLGVRVTVPYYSPVRKVYGKSEIVVGNRVKTMLESESINELALQNQLLKAGKDLNLSLARASLKNVIATETGKLAGSFGLIAGKVAAAATSAAETRNWLMLPGEIRINRISLPSGTHDVKLITKNSAGIEIARETKSVNLKPGEVKVWVKRTIVE